MTRNDIVRAMQSGWIFVCAACDRLWEGKELNLKQEDGSFRCTSKKGCKSPASGGNFCDYQGPITNFSNFCYICGGKADYGLYPEEINGLYRVNGSRKVIGVCEKHKNLIKRKV